MDPTTVFHNPIQIGIIVKDLDELLKNLEEILGVKDFRIASFPPEGCENVTREYHGKQGTFTGKFCFFDWGNIELELIQPISGDSVWFDYLEKTPNGKGIHHIKFMTDHHEPVIEHFAKLEIPCVTKGEGVGPNTGRIWSFYDTFEQLGFDVEVLNRIVE